MMRGEADREMMVFAVFGYLADWLVFSMLGLDPASRVGGALHFV